MIEDDMNINTSAPPPLAPELIEQFRKIVGPRHAITDAADIANPNIVKAIAPLSDEREVAFARDFQRRPAADLGPRFWHHIGIYAYRREALERFVKLQPSEREIDGRLEQMRALDNGMSIAVVRVDSVPLGVDTPADLEAARQILKASRF